MARVVKSAIRSAIRRCGLDIVRHRPVRDPSSFPPDFDEATIEICNAVAPYTMTSPERIEAVVNAVGYLVKHGIQGSIVECGVWRGGSAMAMLLALKRLGDESRELHLYDTFTGMSAPGEVDVSYDGEHARTTYLNVKASDEESHWYWSTLEEVQRNTYSTGYRQDGIHLIPGKVETTIPEHAPSEIALLRLDTDWYESTKHELIHLFPRLQPQGVLIIDDYGHWKGARKAVDEYLSENNVRILLNRIDYTGRIGVKS